MKRICDILMVLLVAVAVTSCGSRADRPGLVAIDSLILHDPDSACEALAVYPADSLTCDDDRAYHALLTTIAHYKAYRPATTDSIINIAVSHYDRNAANTDHRMRSLLYKGCVMEELGNPKEAMRFYKEAQYACPENDHFHMGYIHFRIASIYQNNIKSQEAIKHYMTALREFSGENVFVISCYDNIGKLFMPINIDSALYYTEQSLKLAQKTGDGALVSQKFADLANVHYIKEDYTVAKDLALKAIHNDSVKRFDAYFVAGESFLKLSSPDSALIVLKDAPEAVSQADSLQLYSVLSDIAITTNDIAHSQDYLQKIDSINQIIDKTLFDNTITTIERDIDSKHQQEWEQSLLRAVICTIILFVLFATAMWLYIKEQGKKFTLAKTQIEALNKQVAQYLKSFEDIQLKHEQVMQKTHQEDTALAEKMKLTLESLDNSIKCYSDIMSNLLRQYKATSEAKNSKIKSLMTTEFFEQLQQVVNIRFNNLVIKLRQHIEFGLTEEEINIICLDLCKFPNPILWTYSNCDRYKSLLNKKKIIANKVYHAQSIQNIPELVI